MQRRQVGGDGALWLGDALDVAHDGLVVNVLEAEPQAARGDVARGDGLGFGGEELLRLGRVGPAAGDGGDEARAVEGEGEEEVVFVVGERGEAEARARGVLQVCAGVDYTCDAHCVYMPVRVRVRVRVQGRRERDTEKRESIL